MTCFPFDVVLPDGAERFVVRALATDSRLQREALWDARSVVLAR